jgi:hypothetical protein
MGICPKPFFVLTDIQGQRTELSPQFFSSQRLQHPIFTMCSASKQQLTLRLISERLKDATQKHHLHQHCFMSFKTNKLLYKRREQTSKSLTGTEPLQMTNMMVFIA